MISFYCCLKFEFVSQHQHQQHSVLFTIQLSTLSSQFVGTFIAPYASVCRHIFPSDLQLWITFDQVIQTPKIDFIFNRTTATQSPIPFFPIFHPFGDRTNDKMWIRIDAQLFNAHLKCQLDRFDGRLNFTSIICRWTNYWRRCISARVRSKNNEIGN